MFEKNSTVSRINGFDDFVSSHDVAAMESLEPRILLTTLYSGDVFEFLARTDQDDGVVLRVSVGGTDTIVEILGTGLDDYTNQLKVVDVPGEITQSSFGRQGRVLGGIGGFDNIVPVGPGPIQVYDTITDPTTPALQDRFDPSGDTDLAINAIATDPNTGLTYGFNVWQPPSLTSPNFDPTVPGYIFPLDFSEGGVESPLALELLLIDTSEGNGGRATQVLPNLYAFAQPNVEEDTGEPYPYLNPGVNPGIGHLAEYIWRDPTADKEDDPADPTDPNAQDNPDEPMEQIISCTAAAFNPIDGLLYFVVTGGESELPILFSINPRAQDPNGNITTDAIEKSLQIHAGPNQLSTFTKSPGDDDKWVQSIAFEQLVDPNNGAMARMWVAISEDDDSGGVNQLWQIDPDPNFNMQYDTNIVSRQLTVVAPEDPTAPPDEVEGIVGIDFANDDPLTQETYVFAITFEDAESRLLRVNLQSADGRAPGDAVSYGYTSDAIDRLGDGSTIDDGRDIPRGWNLSGFTYHPTARNPFTGDQGVFYATDIETDELVMLYNFDEEVESRHWGPLDEEWSYTDAFMVYVVQGDSNGYVSVSWVNEANLQQGRPSMPFDDSVDPWFVFHPETGVYDEIDSIPTDTGQALLGTRRYNRTGADPGNTDLVVPVRSLPMLQQIGVVPEGEGTVSSGLRGVESLLTYASNNAAWNLRMLGENIDNVTDMAVSRDGQIVVIDGDGVDNTGIDYVDSDGNGFNFIDTPIAPPDPTGDGLLSRDELLDARLGDQLAIVDPVTGQAGTPISVINAVDNSGLAGIQGLDWGDPNRDGVDNLYGIYNLSNSSNVNPISEVGGINNGSLMAQLNITGVSVSANNDIYAIDEDPMVDPVTGQNFLRLLRISRTSTNGSVQDVVDLGRIMTSAGDAVTDIEALAFNASTQQLYVVGRRRGVGAGTEQELFTLSINSSEIDNSEDHNPDVEVGLAAGDGQLIDLTGAAQQFNIIDLAVTTSNQLFAVATDTVAGFNRILRINRTTNGSVQSVVDLGRIVNAVGQPIVNISSIEVGPNNGLYVVGGINATASQALFVVPKTATDVSGNTPNSAPDNIADELVVQPVDFLGENGITPATTLASLGIGVAAGVNDFQVSQANGTVTSFNLDGVTTIGDLITLISGSGTNLFAILVGGKRLSLIDASVGLGQLQITNLNGTAAVDLGLIYDGYDGSTSTVDVNSDGTPDIIVDTANNKFITGAPIINITDTITGLAYDSGASLFYAAVDDAGDSRLISINPSTATTVDIDSVEVGGGAAQIVGMDFNVDGDLIGLDANTNQVVVIDVADPTNSNVTLENPNYDANLVGYASDSEGNFYSVLDDGLTNTLMEKKVIDEISASLIGGLGITDPITGLAFDSSDALFGARDAAGGGGIDSRLVSIDSTSGAIVDLGQILANSTGVEVSAMDFDASDTLVALDVLNRQFVTVDTATPSNSMVVQAGFVNRNLVGYTFDAATNNFFSVLDDGVSDNTLMMTSAINALTPTLGTLDPSTGLFSAIGSMDPDGILTGGIQTMAFSNNQTLYILDDSGNLFRVTYTYSNTTGTITTINALNLVGQVEDTSGNALVDVSTMDFDVNGKLLVHDKASGQLLDIGYQNPSGGVIIAGQATETGVGTLRPTVGAIAYDSSSGTFYAVDNSTGKLALADSRNGGTAITQEGSASGVNESATLMTLTGTNDDSAIAQSLDSFLWGGPVWGEVNWSGSMDTFYAGWLITGDPEGQGNLNANFYPDNFYFAGDLHNLVSAGPIGSSEGRSSLTDNRTPYDLLDFLAGTEIHVHGRLGQVFSVGESWPGAGVNDGLITATIQVDNIDNFPVEDLTAINYRQKEFEVVMPSTIPPAFQEIYAGQQFMAGELVTLVGGWLSNDPAAGTNIFGTAAISPNRAQYLGSLRNSAAGTNSVYLNGILQGSATYGELVDTYAIGLMGGQTIGVQLTTVGESLMNVGVFDSDMRLIATNYSNVDPDAVNGEMFYFTAEQPGTYFIAVAFTGDFNFNGVVDDFEDTEALLISDDQFYNLSLTDVGNIAFGGMMVRGDFISYQSTPAVSIGNGDLGGINTDFWFSDIEIPLSGEGFAVLDGNLRSVTAEIIGNGTAGAGVLNDIDFNVPNGSVGLIRASLGEAMINPIGNAIGGDYQWLDIFGGLVGPVVANGSIGTINAGTLLDNLIVVNAANDINRPGTIDLIDVAGDMGSPIGFPGPLGSPGGGPQIWTGPGGNVRYIRVGGEVYQDAFYGGGDGTPGVGYSTHDPGESVTLYDDSGAEITITPVGLELYGEDPPFTMDEYLRDDSDAIQFDLDGLPILRSQAAITELVTYGIRGSGGVVIISMTVNGSVNVKSNTYDNLGSSEFGEFIIEGNGRGLEVNADGEVQLVPDEIEAFPYDNRPPREDIFVNITGDAPLDILALQAYSYEDNGTLIYLTTGHYVYGGSLTSFTNSTGGELVNMMVGSVGNLNFAGSIGIPTHHTGSEILPNLFNPNIYNVVLSIASLPITGHRNMVHSLSGFVSIRSDQAVGNILAENFLSGSLNVGTPIGSIIANADGIDDPDIFEGIDGPIYSSSDMHFVNVGEGLAPSGTGNVFFAGLYAGEVVGGTQLNTLSFQTDAPIGANIHRVVADGPNSNIYGDIVAYGDIIEVIAKNGASIVNADIMSVGEFVDEDGQPAPVQDSISLLNSLEFVRSFQVGLTYDLSNELDKRESGVRSIKVTGNGGIIGLYSVGTDIDNISVSDEGFGMLNSRLRVARHGSFGSIRIGGYGIRSTIIDGGMNMGELVATGSGESSSTINYSHTVRYSELIDQMMDYDGKSYYLETGHNMSRLVDINEYLGTTATVREILDPLGQGRDVTATGIIEASQILLSRNLGRVDAYQIRSNVIDGMAIFHVANKIGSIIVRDQDPDHYSINGFEIVTGALDRFQPGANVNMLHMTVAGPIMSVRINGSLLGGSFIEANGPNGYINDVRIMGDLIGDITASGRIGKIQVDGDMSGDVTVRAINLSREALGKLIIGGSLTIGSLDINGSVGLIKTIGSLGSPGDELLVRGDLKKLEVGTKAGAGTVGLNITVQGDLNNATVYGQINGSIVVDGSFKSLTVNASGGPAIISPINVRGDLKAKINNGNVTGDVSVAGDILSFDINDGDLASNLISGGELKSLKITNGDLLDTANVGSSLGDVKKVEIRGGDLNGMVSAANGTIGNITVRGSDMTGTASILAEYLDNLNLDGDIKDGAAINVIKHLKGIKVGGDVEDGATISVGSLGSATFNGNMAAEFSAGRNGKATNVTVKGDLGANGSTFAIDSDTKLTVNGDIVAGSTVSIGGDLNNAKISGTVSGDVFVDGYINSYKAMAMANAMLTAGFGAKNIVFSDTVTNSLIQVGITRNARGQFTQSTSRMAGLNNFTAKELTDSIVAVGADLNKISLSVSMTDSVVMSGLSLGSTAMEAVRSGALTVGVDTPAIISGSDRKLYRGDINKAAVGTMTGSSIAAGVDSVDGVYGNADDSVTTPDVAITGGSSTVKSINIKVDGGGNTVLGDSGVGKDQDNSVGEATFIADLTANTPLEAFFASIGEGAADNTIDVIVGGETLTITIKGPGSIDIHDDPATADRVDSLVLRGTTAKTNITLITTDADALGIGRVISEDDATVGSFVFNGDILGEGGADPDLWFDGPAKNLQFRNMPADAQWDGRVGGDLNTLAIDKQGNGSLVVGGKINKIQLIDSLSSTTGSLLDPLAIWQFGNEHISQMAIDSVGTTWVFDVDTATGIGRLFEVDLATGLPVDSVTPLSLLANLRGGQGIRTTTDPLLEDMQIQTSDGNTSTVNLSAAVTVQDVIDAIGAALPNAADVTVVVNATGTGLTLTDNTGGSAATFRITALNGSLAAADLGILQSDTDNDTIIEGTMVIGAPVTDSFTSEDLDLLGLDFVDGGPDTLLAIASLINYNPTISVGNLFDRPLSLSGLTVSSDGRVIAAETAEFVDIAGDFGGDFDVRALTIDNNDQMYVVAVNASSNFELYQVDRDADSGEVTDFFLLGEITDAAGNVVRNIEAIETDPTTGNLVAVGVRPTVGAGTQQEVFTINPTPVDTDGDLALDEVVATSTASLFEYLQITDATLLSDLNNGGGVDIAGGNIPDLFFNLRDGNVTTVSLTSALNSDIAAVLAAIQSNPNLDARINAAGTGIEVVDITDPATATGAVFTISSIGGTAAEDLGIAQSDTNNDTIIIGTPLYPVDVTDVIAGLAVRSDGAVFATRDFTSGGPTVSTLITFNLSGSGLVTTIGDIEVDNVAAIVRGVDFNSDGQLVGQDFSGGAGEVRRILIDTQLPTESTFMTPAGSDSDDSRGLASDSLDRFYAVNVGTDPNKLMISNTLRDRLVEIDTETGGVIQLGYMRDFYGNYLSGNVMQLAFKADDTLYALINDRDGSGPHTQEEGVSLARIDWTDAMGNGYLLFTDPTDVSKDAVPINGLGGELLDYSGMVVAGNDTIYAVRRNAADTADELVTMTVNAAGGQVASLTPLSSLNNGRGVGIVEDGLADIRIQLRNGTKFDVILDGAQTVQDSIDLINAASVIAGGPADLAQINAAGNGFDLIDTVTGTYTITGATLLTELDNRADVRRLAGDDFSITSVSGITYNVNIPLGIGTTVQDVLDAINTATGGAVLATITADGSGITLTDDPMAISGSTLSVAAINNSLAASDLGLLQTANGPADIDIVGFDIRPKLGMEVLNGSTAATDLGFAASNIDANNDGTLNGTTIFVGTAVNVSNGDQIEVDGAMTRIVGIGLDHQGNLVAMNNDATTELIGLTTDNFADASLFELVTISDLLGSTHSAVDSFAIATNSGEFVSYAYDTGPIDDGLGGTLNGEFFTSPGEVATFGQVDVTGGGNSGKFLQMMPLAIDDANTPVSTTVTGLAVDNGVSGNVFVVTNDAMLLEFDAATGAIVGTGPITQSLTDADTGGVLRIKSIDFNDNDQLIALDSRFNTLYQIVTVNDDPLGTVRGDTVAQLLTGQVNAADLTTLTFDPTVGEMYSFRDSDNAFVQFLAATQTDLNKLRGGIEANTIGNMIVAGDDTTEYYGRVSTSGNTINKVAVTGDFGGTLTSGDSIGNFILTDGDFSGVVFADGDIKSMKINNGEYTDTGVIRSGGHLNNFALNGGDYAGRIAAATAGKLTFSGDGTVTSDILIVGDVNTISFGGDFAGNIDVGSISGSFKLDGDLLSSATIDVTGDLKSMNFNGDVQSGSLLMAGGESKSLNVKGDFAGVVSIGDGLGGGKFDSMTDAILLIGGYTKSLTVSGDMTDTLVSIGTWLGSDGLYNTADDVIAGGTVKSVNINGDIVDSAIVAGVLPSLDKGQGVPNDKRAYVGTTVGDLRDANGGIVGKDVIDDSAEAGGGIVSVIESVRVKGDVINTNASSGRRSVIAAADGIFKLTGPEVRRIMTREYHDPIGAPEVVATAFIPANVYNDAEYRVIFSEPVNTASFVISVDGDNDGMVSGLADTFGSILIQDSAGTVVDDDITLLYTTQRNTFGQEEGVLRIAHPNGFSNYVGPLTVTLSDDITGLTVYDRSSGRSALRDFNQDGVINGVPAGLETPFGGDVVPNDPSEDPFGTTLAGANSVLFVPDDMPDNFIDALDTSFNLTVDDDPILLNSYIDSATDIDIFHITDLQAGQFLAMQYSGVVEPRFAIFYQDDQGTLNDTSDDSFEAVARWESYMIDLSGIDFQAVELAHDGSYFVVVTGYGAVGAYDLSISVSSTDANMAAAVGGVLVGDGTLDMGSGVIETIGYVNNVDNMPKQLVYVNFDGGLSTHGFNAGVVTQPFDADDLDPQLSGHEDWFIEGGNGVTSIVDNMVSIYNDLPQTALTYHGLPADKTLAYNIDLSDDDDWAAFQAATDGLWFTTVDPTTRGLDVASDFSTLFIGDVTSAFMGLLGSASNIDITNMDKADQAFIAAQNHSNTVINVSSANPAAGANQYSTYLANTAAHELGHILGFNHQPTDFVDFMLVPDDPDNDPGTTDDSNQGVALMAYHDIMTRITYLQQLGTKILTTNEFPIGNVDNLDLYLHYLA